MDPLLRRMLSRTGVELTQLGFGGAGLGDLFEIVEDAEASATLQAAWDAGIRYYDTPPWYGRGQSEHRFGRALYRQPRADYVLSTKVGRLFNAFHDAENFEHNFWRGGPEIPAPVRLQLQWGDAELRGQPAAPWRATHRPAADP